MKVSELIELLSKCDPEGDVTSAFEPDNPLDGEDITDVIEIKFHNDGVSPTVVLRR